MEEGPTTRIASQRRTLVWGIDREGPSAVGASVRLVKNNTAVLRRNLSCFPRVRVETRSRGWLAVEQSSQQTAVQTMIYTLGPFSPVVACC